MLRKWEDLPKKMQNDKIYPYYKSLEKKKLSLLIKRIFDIIVSAIMIILLAPLLLVIFILIKKDSKGKAIYKSIRITQYNREFEIYKFRTMVENADKIGSQVTTDNDNRITNIGKTLRKFRLDELPQLFNILKGDMSFVGTRPESKIYVDRYTDEMYATLLLRAGVTSDASVEYKDEAKLIKNSKNVDDTYINQILPEKMNYNLKNLKNFSLKSDFRILIKTVIAVFIK